MRLPDRLPVIVGALVIVGLSVLLWVGLYAGAGLLVNLLGRLP